MTILFMLLREHTKVFRPVQEQGYSYKQILTAYDETETELIAVKVIDFTTTDKNNEYSELIKFTEGLPDGLVIKTFIFKDLTDIQPVADAGNVVLK